MFRGSRGSKPWLHPILLLTLMWVMIPAAMGYYNMVMFWKSAQISVPSLITPNVDVWSNINSQTVSGNCDINAAYVDIYVGGVLETTVACTAGTFTSSISRAVDGAYAITARARDLTGNASALTSIITWTRDTVPPNLNAFTLNGSCSSTIASNMVPAVVTSSADVSTSLAQVRFSLSSTFVNSGWQSYSNPTTYVAPFVAGSAVTRTVYAWLKDKAGNISTNFLSCQVTTNIGMPPDVRFINPTGGTSWTTGQTVHVDWNIQSTPGLTPNPVEIDYTIDNGATWTAIVTNDIATSNGGCVIGTGATGCGEFALPAALNGVTFKLLLRVTDINGAIGTVISGALNVAGLQLFAGNDASQFGSSAMSTSLSFYNSYWNAQNIDSQGNLYALASNCTVYKLDGTTNNISIFIGNQTCPNPDMAGKTRAWSLSNGFIQPYSIAIDSLGNLYFDDSNHGRIIRWNQSTNSFENWAGGMAAPTINTADYAPVTGQNKFAAYISPFSLAIDSQDRIVFSHIAYGQKATPTGFAYWQDYYYQPPLVMLRVNNDSTFEVLVGNYTTSSGPIDNDLGTNHGYMHMWNGETDPAYPAPSGKTPLGNPRPINYHTWGWTPTLGIKRGATDMIYFGTQGSDPTYASADYTQSLWAYNTATKRVNYVYTLGTWYPEEVIWDDSRNKLLVDQHYYSGLTNAVRIIDVSTINDPGSSTIDVTSTPIDGFAGFALDSSGGIYFASNALQRLFYVDPVTRALSVYAGAAPNSGNGGDAKLANFRYPWSLARDSANNIYFHDQTNMEIRMINPSGIISSLGSRSSTFGYSHFRIHPTTQHLVWAADYALLDYSTGGWIQTVPNGNAELSYNAVFDVTTGSHACLFFCADPNVNWWLANAPWPTNLSKNIADGSNGRTAIWAGYVYTPPSGIAFDPVNSDFYYHRYEYYTDFNHWADTSTTPAILPDYSYTDIIGRIGNDANRVFTKMMYVVDIASAGSSNYTQIPDTATGRAGNRTGYFNNAAYSDYPPSAQGGPMHPLQVYNGTIYQNVYSNGQIYAFPPTGNVFSISDTSVANAPFAGGFVHSYLVDGVNSTLYFTQDKYLYVKPLNGGAGTSTLMATLPARMFIGEKSPHAHSILLLYRNQIYEYTNAALIP